MDIRARYSRDVIKNTFIELLKKKPVNKITVKEICDDANINRTTFYKHFDNPYDLLEKLENETFDALVSKITVMKPEIIYKVFYLILQDIYENRDLYTTLFSQTGDKNFRVRIYDLCYDLSMDSIDVYFPLLTPEKKEWLYYFLAEGFNGILNQWIESDFKASPREIIGFIKLLIDALHHSNLK